MIGNLAEWEPNKQMKKVRNLEPLLMGLLSPMRLMIPSPPMTMLEAKIQTMSTRPSTLRLASCAPLHYRLLATRCWKIQ